MISGKYLAIGDAQNEKKHNEICLEKKQAMNQTEKQTSNIFLEQTTSSFRRIRWGRHDAFDSQSMYLSWAPS